MDIRIYSLLEYDLKAGLLIDTNFDSLSGPIFFQPCHFRCNGIWKHHVLFISFLFYIFLLGHFLSYVIFFIDSVLQIPPYLVADSLMR